MKLKLIKRGMVTTLAVVISLALSTSGVLAAETKTRVGGTVFGPGGGTVSGGSVSVTCNGETLADTTNGAGKYLVVFDLEDCPVGSTAFVTANTSEGSGSASGPVVEKPGNGAEANIDVNVLDIVVPEFGAIGAVVTGLASVGGYAFLRMKNRV